MYYIFEILTSYPIFFSFHPHPNFHSINKKGQAQFYTDLKCQENDKEKTLLKSALLSSPHPCHTHTHMLQIFCKIIKSSVMCKVTRKERYRVLARGSTLRSHSSVNLNCQFHQNTDIFSPNVAYASTDT